MVDSGKGKAPSEGRDAPGLGSADALGYRRPLPIFSTNQPSPSANRAALEGFPLNPALTGRMDRIIPEDGARRVPDLAIALKSMVAFWLLYMGLITARALVLQFPHFWEMLGRRSVAMLVGAFITFLVYLALRRFQTSSINKKTVVAGLLCLPASLAFAATNYFLFYVYAPLDAAKSDPPTDEKTPLEVALTSIVESSLSWYFLFAAWAALYVALSYSLQLRAADRRAAMLAREAQEAQLRALRYQINPHFLFNTLNSLSSLVLAQRTETAERMLMNLSTFLRSTLSADPTADVPLEKEIELQQLYLDIEQIRFPDRLQVEIDVPDGLAGARVPALILQPVIENAVKYGVAKSRKPVTVRISAFEEAGRLHIKVKDDGEVPPPGIEEDTGTGVGLRNVHERLVARYGNRAGCFAGPNPEGGFTVHLYMPVVQE